MVYLSRELGRDRVSPSSPIVQDLVCKILPDRRLSYYAANTFKGLIKHVSNSCPHYARVLVNEGLLRADPCYRIDTKDGVTVRAENWPAMVLEKKDDVIHLKLIRNKGPCYGQGNQDNSNERFKCDISTTGPEIVDDENDFLSVAEVEPLIDAMSQLDHQGKVSTPGVETLALELAIRKQQIDGDRCLGSEVLVRSAIANLNGSESDSMSSEPGISAEQGSKPASITIPQRTTPVSRLSQQSSIASLVNKTNENELCMKGTPIEGPTQTQQSPGDGNESVNIEVTSSTASRDCYERIPRKQLCANDKINNEPTNSYLTERRSQNQRRGAKRDSGLKLMIQQRNMPPRLKKLVRIALKEVSEVNGIETHAKEEPTCVETAGIEQLPIFLWPAEPTRSEINQGLFDREDRTEAPVKEDGETDRAETECQLNTAHHREERMLHDILKEIHRKLIKPFRPSPSERLHAILYDIIEDKNPREVVQLLQSIHEKSQRGTSHVGDDETTTALISNNIYKHSQMIINALVPEDFDNPVIAKYWGAVYRLLDEGDS